MRELAQSLGLETEGLNKQQLKAAIKDHQEMAAQPLETVNGEKDEEVNSDDDGSGGGMTPNTNDVFAADSNAKESNAVLELRLKLRLIEAEKAAKLKLTEAEKAVKLKLIEVEEAAKLKLTEAEKAVKLKLVEAVEAAKLKLIEVEEAAKREEWKMQKGRMQLLGM